MMISHQSWTHPAVIHSRQSMRSLSKVSPPTIGIHHGRWVGRSVWYTTWSLGPFHSHHPLHGAPKFVLKQFSKCLQELQKLFIFSQEKQHRLCFPLDLHRPACFGTWRRKVSESGEHVFFKLTVMQILNQTVHPRVIWLPREKGVMIRSCEILFSFNHP